MMIHANYTGIAAGTMMNILIFDDFTILTIIIYFIYFFQSFLIIIIDVIFFITI